MKRMRIIGLSIVAVLAMSAVVASGASAATTLTLKTTGKGALKAGDVIKSDSSNLVTVTAAGNLECTENELLTNVTTNGAVKDFGSITAEKSTGLEGGGACKTTTPLGPALIASSGLPWSLELASNGKGKVKGKKVTFTATFPAAGGAKCVFEASTVKVTFPKLKPKKGFKETGPALVLTTAAQKFKLNKKTSNAACPAEGKLSGEFVVTSGGEPVLPEFSS